MEKRRNKISKKTVLAGLLSIALSTSLVGTSLAFAGAEQVASAGYTVVDANKQYQTWQGWGTSLCWWANAVGGWTMEGVSGKQKREEIMELTFSESGLGLNIVRYNAGGGDDPDHTHMSDYRDMPGIFSSPYASADLSADANQLYVLAEAKRIREETAKKNGTETDFVSEIFNNSPPYYMTESGCSSGNSNAADENLSSLSYDDFVRWYADVVEVLGEAGYTFDYIQPMNEPGSDYWAAYGSQEGNRVYAGDNQSELLVRLKSELKSRGLDALQVTCGDETSSMLAFENYSDLTPAAKAVSDKLNYHIYSKSDESRMLLGDLVYGEERNFSGAEKQLWMSEICYGADIPDSHDDMTYALELASDIRKDAYLAGASAWVFWQVVESELANLSYGNNYGLIHGVFQDEEHNEYGVDMSAAGLAKGDYFLTKQYYALGQYSKYIGSGYKIVWTGDENAVAALSPDGKRLVLVVSNPEASAKKVNYFFSGFDGARAERVETSKDKNWQQSEVGVFNGILKDTVAGESIVTYVIDGSPSRERTAAPDADILSATNCMGSIALSYVAADGNTQYTLYCADSAEKLRGGDMSENFSISLEGAADGRTLYASVPAEGEGERYLVIGCDSGGEKRYTAIVRAEPQNTQNAYTYFTDCGSDSLGTWQGGGGEFGRNYRYTDKTFSLDPASGKVWGNASGGEGETYERNTSEGLFHSCVYGVKGHPVVYRYEVEAGKRYHVTAGFRDVWGNYNRTVELAVNGKTYGTVKCYNDFGSTVLCEGVQGEEQDGRYFITVTASAAEGTTQDALINFIVIQDEENAPADIVFEGLPAITVPYGQNLQSVFPDTLNVVTTHGKRSVARSELRIHPYSYAQVYKAGGYTKVTGELKNSPLAFTLNFSTDNPFEHVYYWYNLGVADGLGNGKPDSPVNMTAAHVSEFEGVYQANRDTLLNTDVKKMNDRVDLTRDPDGCGLVGRDEAGNEYTYPSYWSNNEFMSWSMVEGGTDRTALLNFPSLPANHYVVEVGSVNPKDWGDRSMQLYVNDAEPVLFESKMKDFPFSVQIEVTLEEAGSIRLKAVGTRQNPILTYVIVKTVASTPTEQRPSSPSIDPVLDRNTPAFTVGNLTAGATLVLTDQDGMCLAERTVGRQESEIRFTDFDFTGVLSVTAQQFAATGARSQAVRADVPLLLLSEPRTDWSVSPDTIVVFPTTKVGIAGLYVKPPNGTWTDIKKEKFFRADENGMYTVKLVTKTGVEISESVNVGKVDKVLFTPTADLKSWIDGDLDFTAELELENGVKSILLSGDGGDTDVTQSYVNGAVRFPIYRNGDYTLKVTTSVGGVKEFGFTVRNIDKTTPSISISAEDKNGATVFLIHAVSGSEKLLYVSHGGRTTQITTDFYKPISEGEHLFTVQNSFGVSAREKIFYYTGEASLKEHGVLLSEGKNGVTLTLPQGAEGGSLQQFGSGEAISVDGELLLTHNGIYRLTVEREGQTELYEFTIAAFKTAADAPAANTALPVCLGIGGATAAVVIAVAVLCRLRLRREKR